MATFSVAAAKHATLAASTVDTVTLTGSWDLVDVLNRGTGTIYVTVGPDPADPTVAGDNTTVVPAGGVVTVEVSNRGSQKVKLISSTADAYSVMGHNGSEP